MGEMRGPDVGRGDAAGAGRGWLTAEAYPKVR